MVNEIKKKFYDEKGLVFYDWVDGKFRDKNQITNDWAGIIHNVIDYPPEYYDRKDIEILCLKDLVECDFFRDSMKKCKFLLTLSPTTANFLQSKGINARFVYHPSPKIFCWRGGEKHIVTVGQWMRKISSIDEICAPSFKKTVIKVPWDEPYEKITKGDNVKLIEYLNNEQYDKMIKDSIVFLHLYDVAACNTVLECIMSNTPLLINRLSGAEDYLGKDYPLFYDSLENVPQLLSWDRILDGHAYLKKKDKRTFGIKKFISSLSKIITESYRKIF